VKGSLIAKPLYCGDCRDKRRSPSEKPEQSRACSICIEGSGWLESDGAAYGVDKGEVWLLPAVAGACEFHPNSVVTLLEIALPE
jgi:mannose-6-phosphate isomerase class I